MPPNRCNGASSKSGFFTADGEVKIEMSRDRANMFEPESQSPDPVRRRFNDKIISARHDGVRDQGHLGELYGTEAPPSMISKVIEAARSSLGPLEPVSRSDRCGRLPRGVPG
jgi:transposase-like protein